MAVTNFANLTEHQKQIWSMDWWKTTRNSSFIHKFLGNSENSIIHRVDELKKTEKGTKCVVTLIADGTGDGVTGDYELEGNEESILSFDEEIRIDQLRFAKRHEGKLADQKSIINFRETAKRVLAYQMADRCDQVAFLTLSGVDYKFANDGSLRVETERMGTKLADLEFNADVKAPSAGRHLRIDRSDNNNPGKMSAGNTAALTDSDFLNYRALVKLKAYAHENYVKPVRMKGGQPVYHMFVTPYQMASLRLDDDYLKNLRDAGARGKGNELFAGHDSVLVDGIYIHEDRRVFNTVKAKTGVAANAGSPGYKWGATASVNGARALFCGSQALAFADIGTASMMEKAFDYGNQPGIAFGKMFGFLKPQFMTAPKYKDLEDFGVICLDSAIDPTLA